MAVITVSVRDDVEKKFRRAAAAIYGKGKGSLGKAITEALEEWSDKKTDVERALKLLEQGFEMGRITYKKRAELHERSSN